MDLTEQIYVQCINCHSSIYGSSGPHTDGPICQHCLFYQSKLINHFNHELSTLQNELNTIKQFGVNEAKNQKEGVQSCEDGQRQLGLLEKQLQLLMREQQQLDNNQRQLVLKSYFLVASFQQTSRTLQFECQKLGAKINELNALCKNQAQLMLQVSELRRKKESLLGYSVLIELYKIHFDDQHAFINRQPINVDNLDPLLEIISYLIKKYNFHSIQINIPENMIKLTNGVIIPMQKTPFQGLKRWIEVIVKQTVNLWQHIKQTCQSLTNQTFKQYRLPFKSAFEPQFSINGHSLTSESKLTSILKYLTHNIKYMISFDSDIELKGFSKWQVSKSEGLQRME